MCHRWRAQAERVSLQEKKKAAVSAVREGQEGPGICARGGRQAQAAPGLIGQ